MTFTVLIPARMDSSRLPGKPLADLGGCPMIVRVARQALKSHAAQVVVATDSEDIIEACRTHHVDAILTDATHESGTDRVAQAARLLGLNPEAAIVNVQGDEPLIEPALIDAVAARIHAGALMSTVAHALDEADLHNPNVVKLVCNQQGDALYFSRAPIPFAREGRHAAPLLRHVGLYGYRMDFLQRFAAMPVCALEDTEKLEQLRVLYAGEKIAVVTSEHTLPAGVDTPEDLARVRTILGVQAA